MDSYFMKLRESLSSLFARGSSTLAQIGSVICTTRHRRRSRDHLGHCRSPSAFARREGQSPDRPKPRRSLSPQGRAADLRFLCVESCVRADRSGHLARTRTTHPTGVTVTLNSTDSFPILMIALAIGITRTRRLSRVASVLHGANSMVRKCLYSYETGGPPGIVG